ncbi:hypothetical protein AAJM66_12075, partial [Staphylococcus capitis]|uniref:tyrosine-type recombinase/integrase n=1 Tax=Staphylococcus capitis TaxID=29388 RepID=UPI0031BB6148
TTAGTYRTALRVAIIPTFGPKTLGNVRPIDVAEWLAKLTADGKSPGWVRQCYRLLSMVMRAAVENDLIQVTPCRGHRLPRTTDPEPVILTTEQIAELASHCKHPSNLLVLLLGYAGLRIGEAFALRQRDIRDAGRTIMVAQRKAEIAGKPDWDLPKSH